MTTRQKISAAVVALMIAAGLSVALTPSTGANYTATNQGNVDIKAGNLQLAVNGNSTFQLSYDRLSPGGAEGTSKVTVTNIGDVAASSVSLDIPGTLTKFSVPSGQQPDIGQLEYMVDGITDYTSATALPAHIELGTLAAGQTKVYAVKVKIVSVNDAVDNQWQKVEIGADASITLRS